MRPPRVLIPIWERAFDFDSGEGLEERYGRAREGTCRVTPHTCREPAALCPLIQLASRVGLGHLGVEEMLGHA